MQVLDSSLSGSGLASGPFGLHALKGAKILQGILGSLYWKRGQWLVSGKSDKTSTASQATLKRAGSLFIPLDAIGLTLD